MLSVRNRGEVRALNFIESHQLSLQPVPVELHSAPLSLAELTEYVHVDNYIPILIPLCTKPDSPPLLCQYIAM